MESRRQRPGASVHPPEAQTTIPRKSKLPVFLEVHLSAIAQVPLPPPPPRWLQSPHDPLAHPLFPAISRCDAANLQEGELHGSILSTQAVSRKKRMGLVVGIIGMASVVRVEDSVEMRRVD